MKILIDGYNLLHASGIFGGVRGAGGFEASRRELLSTIAGLLGPARGSVTVIFDAADAPPGLPARYAHDGIDVRFAREHGSADAMIEDLIETHDAPTALTVVSSDHRVMAAARRRRCKPVGSGEWLAAARAAARATAERQETKPPEPQTDVEVNRWLEEFGL